MGKPINFSHAGKMGDMFHCLPILSASYKSTGNKCNLYLANFDFIEQSVEILKMQECINDVIVTDYIPNDYGCGGQPYKFRDDCISLGFRHFPNKSYMEFVAEEHRLLVDYDFTLNLGDWISSSSCYDVNFSDLSMDNTLLSNIRYAYRAMNVNVKIGCPAMLLHLARKYCTIECPSGWLMNLHINYVYTLHNNYNLIGIDNEKSII